MSLEELNHAITEAEYVRDLEVGVLAEALAKIFGGRKRK